MALVEALISKLLRPPRILLAEDDVAVGSMFLSCLREEYECEVDWAIDGERAIEFIGKRAHDLVFLNLVMPKKNGVEVLRYIKSHKPALPVIVITGYMDSTLWIEAASLGVVGVLTKPFQSLNFGDIFQTYNIRAITKRETEEYRYYLSPMPA